MKNNLDFNTVSFGGRLETEDWRCNNPSIKKMVVPKN
jgi:hypothetical protein